MTQLASKWVLTLATLSLAGCLGTLSGGPIRGQVLDASTHQPLAKAIVVVRWEGRVSGSLVESQSTCYHAETTMTDAKGNYFIPRWSRKITADWEEGIFDKDRSINAYKPGYQRSSINYGQPENFAMEPFTGTAAERIDYLVRGLGSCGASDGSDRNLLPLQKSLYNESLQYPRDSKKESPTEMNFQEAIRYQMEILEYGYEQAEKRHLERY